MAARTTDDEIVRQLLGSLVVLRNERNQQRNRVRPALSRSYDAVIRVYDETGNVIETHEHAGDFKECKRAKQKAATR